MAVLLLLGVLLTALLSLLMMPSTSLLEADGSPTSGPASATPEPIQRLRSGSVRILLYHHFAADENATTISPERLEEHLTTLTQAGYHFITLAQFEAFLRGEADLDDRSLLLTIDDGYASIYEVARPVLMKHQVPALVFLVTGQIDRPDEGALPKLSRSQIRALLETGLFTFGGHGSGHGNPTVAGRSNLVLPFPGEPAQIFLDRVEADLAAMQSVLASVGGRGAHFAFPYGHVSARLAAQLRRQGVRYAYTTEPGLVTSRTDRLRLPRFHAGAAWVTGGLLVRMLADDRSLPPPSQVEPE